ncbi:MAG: hypothetical protein P4L76_17740 [Beijerinckiaceae bacterium]|nr:hypothetical protein [Beijerinckiaceae bacterium]
MANPPAEPALPVDNVQQLIENMVVDAGVVGIDEEIEQPILNRAFRQINWLLAQWARKRWLVYRLVDYSFVSTGAKTYSVGKGGVVNINPRPDRMEYAFVRFLNTSNNNSLPVDVRLGLITSHEDYSRIRVKDVGTLPWEIFYDPDWPVGVLRPWPVPQASLYEIHVGFKVVLPRFASLQQAINFPPEYEAALNFCGARRLRASYQLPPDPEINALARESLAVIRAANIAMPTLTLPRSVRTRRTAYDYRSDGN